jgi:16S rRNA (uracil1498-N3)-methyltransferase
MSGSSIRLFVAGDLVAGAAVPGSEAQAHYLANVMRRSVGDAVILFNGRDGEWAARIVSVSRKAVMFEVGVLLRGQAAEPDCWLCFALLKRNKTDMVVEKATELGVSRILPVLTARTQTDHVNLERLRAIAVEAAEQCERLAVPEIVSPVTLPALLTGWPAGRRLFMADERRTAKVARFSSGPASLLVGPEGGFTEAEVAAIRANQHVTIVSLGARILRAETAAIAGLALLLASDPPEE